MLHFLTKLVHHFGQFFDVPMQAIVSATATVFPVLIPMLAMIAIPALELLDLAHDTMGLILHPRGHEILRGLVQVMDAAFQFVVLTFLVMLSALLMLAMRVAAFQALHLSVDVA